MKKVAIFAAGLATGFVLPLVSLVMDARDGKVIAESDTMEYRLCKNADNIAIGFNKGNNSEE